MTLRCRGQRAAWTRRGLGRKVGKRTVPPGETSKGQTPEQPLSRAPTAQATRAMLSPEAPP